MFCRIMLYGSKLCTDRIHIAFAIGRSVGYIWVSFSNISVFMGVHVWLFSASVSSL